MSQPLPTTRLAMNVNPMPVPAGGGPTGATSCSIFGLCLVNPHGSRPSSINKCHQDVENLQLLTSSWQVWEGAVHYHCYQSASGAQWNDYLISVIPSVIKGYHGNWCAPVDAPLPFSPWHTCHTMVSQLYCSNWYFHQLNPACHQKNCII